jgi:hypothetical protein
MSRYGVTAAPGQTACRAHRVDRRAYEGKPELQAIAGDGKAYVPEEREQRIQAIIAEQDDRDEARRQRATRNWSPPACKDSRDLTLHHPDWVIQDYIERGTVGLLVGAYGTAKTFLALDWACCAATGRRWHGHKVRLGNVLYVVAEGAQGIGNRKTAWEITNTVIEKDAVVFITGTVPLDNPAAVDWLRQKIIYYEADILFIDTIARNKGGAAENEGDDVGKLIEVMYGLRDARGENMTTVTGLHHTGKDKNRGARGSSRWSCDVDFLHELDGKDSNFTLRTEKMKDSGKAAPWRFTLHEVEVSAATEDQEAITSCVIEPAAAGPAWEAAEKDDEQIFAHLREHQGDTLRNMVTALGRNRSNLSGRLNELEIAGNVRSEQARSGAAKHWFVQGVDAI